MLRLDHNRALSQLAAKIGKPVNRIEKTAVWGNHSPTMYADYRFASVDGISVKDLIAVHAGKVVDGCPKQPVFYAIDGFAILQPLLKAHCGQRSMA